MRNQNQSETSSWRSVDSTFFLLAGAAATLLACGGGETSVGQPNEVRSDKPFAPERPGVTNEALASLWRAQLEVAVGVYEHLSGANALTENFAYSPASVSIALAMTSAGASGSALDQLASTMGFPAQATLHDLMAASIGVAHALNHDAIGDLEDGGVDAQRLRLVNALWPQEGLAIKAPFLDEMSISYDTGVYPVDFAGATEHARLAINGWVGDNTEDKIPELLAPGTLSDSTKLTLVNAIYLRAPWRTAFDPSLTADEAFYVPTPEGPTAVNVPFMRGTVDVEAGVIEGDLAVRVTKLRYGHNDLAFYIVDATCPAGEACDSSQLPPVPADRLADALEATLVPATYSLSIPKFTLRTASALKAPLTAMGMTAPFEGGIAGIADVDLKIEEVIHQAYIAIDERGTEGAAATAVVINDTSAGEARTIDHAFWFVVRDEAASMPLFIGFVADPR